MRHTIHYLSVILLLFGVLTGLNFVSSTSLKPIDSTPDDLHSVRDINNSFTTTEITEVVRDWQINIALIGIDPDVFNETRFLSYLPTQHIFPYDNLTFIWNIDYQITWCNASYENDLKSFMLTNSINGTDTGTELNQTALLEMLPTPWIPKACFYPRDGRAINGTLTEEWLIENPAVVTPDLGWTLYLLNFSEIDSPDHSLEHWFDYGPRDIDSGRDIDWFRLEWENDLNPNIKFQYSGVGGHDKIHILDLSADQWYMKWAQLWWYGTEEGAVGAHIMNDMDTFVDGMDLFQVENQNNLTSYVANYSLDIIDNMFLPTFHAYTTPTERGSFRVLVFTMDPDVTPESIEWIDNEEILQSSLDDTLPFADWYVQVDYLNISDYLDWNSTFYANSVVNDGITVVDGMMLFFDIYNNLKPTYSLTDGYDTSLFGVVFMKKDMVMTFAGKNYTALGGSGMTMICKSYERYFLDDGITHKGGATATQIHELGHAMGLQHTFANSRYGGDFQSGVMGYFCKHKGFSTFESTWLKASYLDGLTDRMYKTFLDVSSLINGSSPQKTLDAKNNAEQEFYLAESSFNSGDWLGTHDHLLNFGDWTTRILWSLSDNDAPVFTDWGIDQDDLMPGDSFTIYANVTDSLSGIENVTAVLSFPNITSSRKLLTWNGSYYTCESGWPVELWEFDLQLVAFDWGMNAEVTSTMALDGDNVVPYVSINSPSDMAELEGVITFEASAEDSISGIYRVGFYLEGVNFAYDYSFPYSSSFNLSLLSLGMYRFNVIAFDNAGNLGIDSINITVVDTINPSIDSPADIEFSEGDTDFFIVWNPTDLRPAIYEVYINSILSFSGTWNASAEKVNVSLNGLALGMYNCTCIVYDDAGNFAVDSINVNVTDLTAPSISNPEDIEFTEGQTGYEVEWNGTDLHPYQYTILRDGLSVASGFWNSSSEILSISLDGLLAGNYNYTCVLYDSNGNYIWDSVFVTINEIIIPTTTTTTPSTTSFTATSPTTTFPQISDITVLVLIGFIGIIAILVIILLLRRR